MVRMGDLPACVLGETLVTTHHLWEGDTWLLGLELHLIQAQEIPIVVVLIVCLFYLFGKKQSCHWKTVNQNKESDNGIFCH